MIKTVIFFERLLMTRQELNDMLIKAQMSKEEFSQKVGLKYTSVNNWGSSQEVPRWVESWLLLYVENLQCKKLKIAIKQINVDE
jgi:DNA-binding transcriptional regulator YiaG